MAAVTQLQETDEDRSITSCHREKNTTQKYALTFTSISAVHFSRSPGNVIEETIALFTVQPLGVVFADTSPMYLKSEKYSTLSVFNDN